MGAAFEIVSGRVSDPGAALTALTPNTGDSFTVRSFPEASKAHLANIWSENASGGVLSIHSPRLHDDVQGIRLQVPAAQTVQELPLHAWQELFPNDPLNVSMSGGAAEEDLLSYLVYYDNLGGINQALAMWAEVRPRIVNLMGLEVDLASGATAGDYGGTRAMNADFPQLKAGLTYAVLGYTCASAFGTLGIKGTDTGNLRVGGPGSTRTDITAGWFINLSEKLGKPCIPLIQADNAPNTNLDLTASDTATAHHVSLVLAQLK